MLCFQSGLPDVDGWSDLVAGSASGALLVAIILFLRHLAGERKSRDETLEAERNSRDEMMKEFLGAMSKHADAVTDVSREVALMRRESRPAS